MSVRRRAATVLSLSVLAATALAGCARENDADAAPAVGSSAAVEGVVVTDAWVRATTGSQDPSMTAAFMSIQNGGPEVALTGAETDAAGRTEIHEMVMGEAGAMVMQEKAGGLPLPTGAHEHLEPGGTHVMLMDLTRALAPGDEVDLTLRLSDGTTQELTVPVKEFPEEEGHYHSHSPSPSH